MGRRVPLIGAGGLGSLACTVSPPGYRSDDPGRCRQRGAIALQRQFLHHARIGMPKTESARRSRRPGSTVRTLDTRNERLRAGNLEALTASTVASATARTPFPDAPYAHLRRDHRRSFETPLVYGPNASLHRSWSACSIRGGRTHRCYRCLFPGRDAGGEDRRTRRRPAPGLGVLPGHHGVAAGAGGGIKRSSTHRHHAGRAPVVLRCARGDIPQLRLPLAIRIVQRCGAKRRSCCGASRGFANALATRVHATKGSCSASPRVRGGATAPTRSGGRGRAGQAAASVNFTTTSRARDRTEHRPGLLRHTAAGAVVQRDQQTISITRQADLLEAKKAATSRAARFGRGVFHAAMRVSSSQGSLNCAVGCADSVDEDCGNGSRRRRVIATNA